MLEGFLVSGRFPADPPLAADDGIEAHAPAEVVARCRMHIPTPEGPAAWLPALLTLARPGDYLAVLACLHRTPARHERLQRLREAVREQHRLATTLGYGPRYLHSTGQLHKGGPDTLVAIQVVDSTGDEIPIPGQPYGFGKLIRAQAAGDFASLKERGRRVARVRLEDL